MSDSSRSPDVMSNATAMASLLSKSGHEGSTLDGVGSLAIDGSDIRADGSLTLVYTLRMELPARSRKRYQRK